MLSLVIGGARSGKSELAEEKAILLSSTQGTADPKGGPLNGPITYVATAQITDGDMAIRVDAHRRRRPSDWATVEVGAGGDLAQVLFELEGVAIVDSLGTWVAGFEQFAYERDRLPKALRLRKGSTVVVTEEVGLGVHPSSDSGRLFRDRLGDLNKMVAAISDEVWLVVAGLPVRIGGFAS
ncbi:MAG TPA: bifunctional adenosylcobinamide kinase/adenosylcobinamide-phosphate guanylyltransferase [Acidimicrobiales bacterium]|nr:bifunctional adenosylcobinamide kinase/adenosylcobinamide-phosphate guanylyltransferase [Acidimicrobiales bacterium]